MKKYQNKFLWRNLFYNNFTIVIIFILIGFVLNGLINLYSKYRTTKEDLNYIRKEEAEDKNKLSIERDKLENINTEEGKDKYIRSTYPVKKEGEGLVVVYDAASSTYEIPKAESFFDSFKNMIRNLLGK
jgi:predicted membrane protein